jgi:hypothetical protein
MSNCIVSVAFREPYLTHSIRQEKHYGDYDRIVFRDELPIKNGTVIGEELIPTFQKSLYGFKPHAIQRAIELGYKKIIWLDPSVLPTSDIKILFDALDEHPILNVLGEHKLAKMTSDKALLYFKVQPSEIDNINHLGGTIYGFNFNNSKAEGVFNLWKKAEEEGAFGNQNEFMAGHWADESCMALCMYKAGVPQYQEYKFTYVNQKNL